MIRRWRAGAGCVVAAATLVACASSTGAGSNSASHPRGRPVPRGGTCGRVPTSSGPLVHVARLIVTGSATSSSGELLPVAATVESSSTARRVVTTPAGSAVLVVRGDRIVGRTAAAASTVQIPLPVDGTTRPAQAVPRSVRLASCSGSAALSPGRYALVAVLGYQLDPLNDAPADAGTPPPASGRSFALVSAPRPITLR